MTGTIAAGEIREHDGRMSYGITVFPFDSHKPTIAASVDKDIGMPCVSLHFGGGAVPLVVLPAEARDFARAILAAADWAERQGR